MSGGDVWRYENEPLSPQVERFLLPRVTPPVRTAVIQGVRSGIWGSIAAAIVLLLIDPEINGNAMLAVRTLALRLAGDASFAGSIAGPVLVGIISLAGGACAGGVYGLVMAKLIGDAGSVTSLVAGVSYAVLVWIIVQYVALSYFAPDAVVLLNQRVLLSLHVVYGATLGLLGAKAAAAART